MQHPNTERFENSSMIVMQKMINHDPRISYPAWGSHGKSHFDPHFLTAFAIISVCAGVACKAAPNCVLILCVCVCESEIISRPLIGRKLAMSPGLVKHS